MVKKRLLFVLLLIFVIVLSGCNKTSEENKIAGDKTTGGVVICGQDYSCGNSDDICPENYGASCKLEDPDCKE